MPVAVSVVAHANAGCSAFDAHAKSAVYCCCADIFDGAVIGVVADAVAVAVVVTVAVAVVVIADAVDRWKCKGEGSNKNQLQHQQLHQQQH